MYRQSDQRQEFITQSAALLYAMANSTRIEILDILLRGEISVSALSVKVKLSQSALSQHLAKLREAGLVQTRRDATTIYYMSTSDPVSRILDTLREIAGDIPAEVKQTLEMHEQPKLRNQNAKAGI